MERAGNELFVSNTGTNFISLIDTTTGKETGKITVGDHTGGVGVLRRTDNTFILPKSCLKGLKLG